MIVEFCTGYCMLFLPVKAKVPRKILVVPEFVACQGINPAGEAGAPQAAPPAVTRFQPTLPIPCKTAHRARNRDN
jgi:hypothetical protein